MKGGYKVDFLCKYICTRFVAFTDKESNKKVTGYITYVFNESTNEIIKCKMCENCPTNYSFGDECFITLVVNGHYAHYSFKNS